MINSVTDNPKLVGTGSLQKVLSGSKSAPRKRYSALGEERTERLGPKWNRKKNVSIPEQKPRHGAEFPLHKTIQKLEAVPPQSNSQKMTIYDYLDMGQVAQGLPDWNRLQQHFLGMNVPPPVSPGNVLSGSSTFRSQFSHATFGAKIEMTDEAARNEGAGRRGDGEPHAAMTLTDSSYEIAAVPKVVNGEERLEDKGTNAFSDSAPGSRTGVHSSEVDSRARAHSHTLPMLSSRPISPSSVNDGISAASACEDMGLDCALGIASRWERKQRILAENWNVIQKWEKEARERGNLMGISYVGRKVQRIQPSKQVRLPGVDEPEPVVAPPSLESLGLERVDTTAEYANLSRWQMGSTDATNKLLHFRLVQSIIVRESLILQLDKLVQSIECHYYEYGLLRIQSHDLGFPMNSEQLVVKKAKAVEYQVELRVALANYRTATMTVFEDLIKWRNDCRRDVLMKDANVVMMWHGQNYMLKMTHDIAFLYRYSVVRLWLEFEPNMFMIPPSQLAASNAQVRNAIANSSSSQVPLSLLQEPGQGQAKLHAAWSFDQNETGSVCSDVTGENNINDSFFGLPGHLPPLGRTPQIEEKDRDLLSVISDQSAVNYRSYYESKLRLFDDWNAQHKAFLANKRQELLKSRRLEEKEERDQENKRDLIEQEFKHQRIMRHQDRNKLEEKEKREKNLEVLRIQALREAAGESQEKIKEAKSKEEIELDEIEAAVKRERDREERACVQHENDQKALREAAWKEEKAEKARLASESEQNRLDTGIQKILTDSADCIEASIPLNDGEKEWQLLRNICLASWKCTNIQSNTILPDGRVDYSTYNDAKRSMIWEQGPLAAPNFWCNYEISPLVVETASGFKELWPRGSSIVPPLPEKLFRACSTFRRFLELEKRKLSKLQDDKIAGRELRNKISAAPTMVYFDSEGISANQDQDQDQDYDRDEIYATNRFGSKGVSTTGSRVRSGSSVGLAVRMDDEDTGATESIKARLRKRQETDVNLVDGTLRIYKEIAHLDPKRTGVQPHNASLRARLLRNDDKKSFHLLKFNSATITSVVPDLLASSVVRTESSIVSTSQDFAAKNTDMGGGVGAGQGRDVFSMTRTLEEYSEGLNFNQSSAQKLHVPQVRDGTTYIDESTDPMYNRRSEDSVYYEKPGPHPTGLESVRTKSMELSERSVRSERTLLGRDREGVPIIRPEQQHRRPPDYSRPYWQHKLASRIQALIRGMMCRAYLKRARQKVALMKAVLRIQSQFRRCLGVRLYQEKKADFQIEIEKVRKIIVKRHNAALSITKFLRWCGAYNIGMVVVNPMVAYANAAAKSRAKAKAARMRRAHEYSQNANQMTTDGTSMTVRYSRGSSRGSSRGGGSRGGQRSPTPGGECQGNGPDGPGATSPAAGQASSNEQRISSHGQVVPGEFDGNHETPVQTTKQFALSSTQGHDKGKLNNIFKVIPRSGSRLIPLTVKPGNVASQPGTSKPRFRPFAVRDREFMHDVHRPEPEKTVKHPNDCYRPPPALLTNKQREAISKEIAAKEAIEAEVGVEIINKRKLEDMRMQVRNAMLHGSK
jgi:hypothetical protein